jgi:tetratricopeptide (TPR) repeat protein
LIIQEATALHARGATVEAETMLRTALLVHPQSVILNNACGVMLAALGRPRDAVACYRQALRQEVCEPGVWTNLGNALTSLKLFDSAVASHDAALARAPNDGILHYNRGISLAEAGHHGAAVAAFTAALRHAPDHPMAAWDRARSYLHLGNLAAGWLDYEIRLSNGLVPPRPVPGTRWEGQPYTGRRLLLLAEQGFGDMIWVSRFIPHVKALGGELIVESPPELAGLHRTAGLADRVIIQGETLPPADLHLWQCSLPGLFANTLASLAPAVELTPARTVRARFQPLFAPADGKLKIGIIWSGSTSFGRNTERATRLAPFIDAFDLPGVQLYSLQKGPPAQELADAALDSVIDLGPHLQGFDDTAAALSHLDLVIMTDSAVAHLAGTMHQPVWVLLGRNAHWLWLAERADSPWYPSMRLFRPRGDDDWSFVFDQAAKALWHRLNQPRSFFR